MTFKWIFLLAFAALSTKAQLHNPNSINKFIFTQLTFHEGNCNGSCPSFSININRDMKVEISRTIYKKKGVVDIKKSGNFIGQLNKNVFNNFLNLIRAINWDTLTMPKVYCCDAGIKIFNISYNNRKARFISMFPPKCTSDLLVFLRSLATSPNFERIKQDIYFQN